MKSRVLVLVALFGLLAVMVTARRACGSASGLVRETPPPLPTSPELERAFSTAGEAPWRFTPGAGGACRRLNASAPWDLRAAERLVVLARVVQGERQAVRLRWMVVSRVGGTYTAEKATLIPVVGAPAEAAVEFQPEAGALVPAGHQRPWDALAAAEVLALELRTEVCGGNAPVTVELRDPRVQFTASAPQARQKATARLLDARLEAPPADQDAAATLSFRLDPLPDDPFAVSGEGDVRVRLPSGREVLAYLDQAHCSVADGWAVRRVAAGAPRFRAHLPELPEYGSLRVSSGEREWELPRAALGPVAPRPRDPESRRPGTPLPREAASEAVTPGATGERSTSDEQAGAPGRERWAPPLEVPAQPPADPLAFGRWPGAPPAWKLSFDGAPAWQVSAAPAGPRAWRPLLFWNARWGGFNGVQRPDFVLAGGLDLLLAAAGAEDRRQPVVLLDGEGFARQGIFTWQSHPLNVAQGGPLTGPGQLLRTEAGLDYCLRVARYVLARWGRSRAVSSFLLTAMPSTPGVADFHARVATALRGWLTPLGKPLYTLHPLPREPRVVKKVENMQPFGSAEGGPWRVAEPLPAQLHYLALRGDASGAAGENAVEVTAGAGAESLCALKPLRFPVALYNQPLPDDFLGADALLFEVWLPADAPSDLRAGVHLRDRDGLWFQALLPGLLSPGDWTTCILDLTGRNAHGLTGVGHEKAWTEYSRTRLIELGLHVYTTHPARELTARLARVRGVRFERLAAEPPRRISLADLPPQTPRRGELWECHLQLNRAYDNPFDPRQVDLSAVITTPSGQTARVPAFFDQPCRRREAHPGGAEVVEPVGGERWTVRYRVLEEGRHRVVFEWREGGEYQTVSQRWVPDSRFSPEGEPGQPFIQNSQDWVFHYPEASWNGRRLVQKVRYEPGPVVVALETDAAAFTAGPAAPTWHGFLRVDADQRHFRFDDGSFYYALGPCVRSPSDRRRAYDDPRWSDDEIDRLAKRGTYQYDEYFHAFEQAGINWTRVWLCSWWCGLQWRRDWPGYQGLGRYNLPNAWRMDHILDEAERRGVRVSLCLTNHGQFSRVIDVEWQNNPYNRQLGGPLGSASEFFTKAEAKLAHQNYLRYAVARWGHSPAVLAWDLFSELEFTEEYRPSLVPGPHADRPAPHIQAWHVEMAEFLKQTDPNQHLVGTHFSHPMRGAGTLALPQVDVATSNAYSAFEELAGGNNDAAAALAAFWDGDEATVEGFLGFRAFRKPALVEEQGRHWMGVESREGRRLVHNTRDNLDADLHAGLWGSLVQPLAGATGYWWWLHVHFDNRYGEYRALASFLEGEDLRAGPGEAPLEPVLLNVASDPPLLMARARRSQERAYVWVYHRGLPFRTQGFMEARGARVTLPGLKAGRYAIEYWDTHTGQRTARTVVNLEASRPRAAGVGTLEILLPPVKGDLAIKVKKSG